MTRRALVLVASVVALLAIAPSSSLAAANFTWKPLGKVKNLGGGSLDKVECPTTSLCVAGGSHAIWVTTNASAKAAQWKRVAVSRKDPTLGESYIYEVSCPSADFCAVGDSNSNVMTSATPGTPNAAAWAVRTAPYTGVYAGVGGLACTGPTLCAMSDYNGALSTTTTPLTGGGWTSFTTPKPAGSGIGDGIKDVACFDKTCTAVFAGKELWVTSDATAQPAKWRKLRVVTGFRELWTVACKTAKLCLAGGPGGLRVTTDAVTGGAGTWKQVSLKLGSIEHLACTKAMCMATSNVDVWWSPTPQVARSWKKSPSGSRTILSDVACPTPNLCVASNVGGQLFVGRR